MQYLSDPLAAPPGGSISPAEARELVTYAAKYHVTIIPEQEAFGHLHFMLEQELYAPLAETPHGHVIAPGAPGAIPFVDRMFRELARDYPGPFLHLGADETLELGKGATKADVDARGLGPVYLDFLQKIVTDLKPLNRTLLFWGDVAQKEPALVKALPADFKHSTIAVAWEYNPHPSFVPYIKPYTDANQPCWVAPGVNNWNRPFPDNNLTLPNIQGFTAQAQLSGCTGQLNTVWDDDGEALFNANWYGVLFGAAAAWQPGESSIPQFQRSYGRVFHGDMTGKIDAAEQELMAAHLLLKDSYTKGADANDFLFWIDPFTAEGQRIATKLRPLNHELRLHAEKALVLVREARNAAPLREQDALDAMELGARRIDFIGLKFQIADEIATEYAKAYGLQGSKVRTDRAELIRSLSDIAHPNSVQGKMEDLRNNYGMMRDLYEEAWLEELPTVLPAHHERTLHAGGGYLDPARRQGASGTACLERQQRAAAGVRLRHSAAGHRTMRSIAGIAAGTLVTHDAVGRTAAHPDGRRQDCKGHHAGRNRCTGRNAAPAGPYPERRLFRHPRAWRGWQRRDGRHTGVHPSRWNDAGDVWDGVVPGDDCHNHGRLDAAGAGRYCSRSAGRGRSTGRRHRSAFTWKDRFCRMRNAASIPRRSCSRHPSRCLSGFGRPRRGLFG